MNVNKSSAPSPQRNIERLEHISPSCSDFVFNDPSVHPEMFCLQTSPGYSHLLIGGPGYSIPCEYCEFEYLLKISPENPTCSQLCLHGKDLKGLHRL